MSKFETPGMRRKERILEGKAARPVTVATVLVKAKMAGLQTTESRDGKPACITAGGTTAHLTEFPEYVFADVMKPQFEHQRLRLHSIAEVQQFLKDLSQSTAASAGGSTPTKEGNRP